MESSQIETQLREIICKRVSGVKPAAVTMTVELATLGIDSLAFSWILADMEEAFNFEMRGADVMKLKTLAVAVDFVEQHVKK